MRYGNRLSIQVHTTNKKLLKLILPANTLEYITVYVNFNAHKKFHRPFTALFNITFLFNVIEINKKIYFFAILLRLIIPLYTRVLV